MDSKICDIFNTEKSNDSLYNKYREYKQCFKKRSLKRYYENKDKISNQRKLFYGKNKEKLLKKQDNRNLYCKELVRSYILYYKVD